MSSLTTDEQVAAMASAERKTPFRVKCLICKHRWTAAFVPMELRLFAEVVKSQRCPSCGSASDAHAAMQEGEQFELPMRGPGVEPPADELSTLRVRVAAFDHELAESLRWAMDTAGGIPAGAVPEVQIFLRRVDAALDYLRRFMEATK